MSEPKLTEKLGFEEGLAFIEGRIRALRLAAGAGETRYDPDDIRLLFAAYDEALEQAAKVIRTYVYCK